MAGARRRGGAGAGARAAISILLLAFAVGGTFVPAFWRFVYPIHYYGAIRQGARAAAVDPLLVAAVARVESHFREDDISHAGAVGLMQLMPNTAVWLSGQIGLKLRNAEELARPDINVRLGSLYLAYLLRIFRGHLPEAVAAYNAGPGRVQHWLADGVWSGDEVAVEDIPIRETRHFVARVLYTYRIFRRFY